MGKSEVLKTGAKGWCQTDWIQNCNLAPRNLCPWKFVDKKVTLFCFFCYQMMFLLLSDVSLSKFFYANIFEMHNCILLLCFESSRVISFHRHGFALAKKGDLWVQWEMNLKLHKTHQKESKISQEWGLGWDHGTFNWSPLGKWLWHFGEEGDHLWRRVVGMKYGKLGVSRQQSN